MPVDDFAPISTDNDECTYFALTRHSFTVFSGPREFEEITIDKRIFSGYDVPAYSRFDRRLPQSQQRREIMDKYARIMSLQFRFLVYSLMLFLLGFLLMALVFGFIDGFQSKAPAWFGYIFSIIVAYLFTSVTILFAHWTHVLGHMVRDLNGFELERQTGHLWEVESKSVWRMWFLLIVKDSNKYRPYVVVKLTFKESVATQ